MPGCSICTAEKSAERIDTLVDRFGLRKHMDVLAASLPLGMRQRLSLAVAVIHEPEMLILDEPTSGVDPVARDEFWELLVELSRRDKVTIFISTHFMNEALRCDRISLMHAGQVLVYDEPRAPGRSQGCGLDWRRPSSATSRTRSASRTIEGATGELRRGSAHGVERRCKTSDAKLHGFSLDRLLAYSYRETMEVMRDPVRLAFAFLGSAILLMVIAYGISLGRRKSDLCRIRSGSHTREPAVSE